MKKTVRSCPTVRSYPRLPGLTPTKCDICVFRCHYELTVPFNRTIQMVWLNMGSGRGWAHPIHLHGHSFYLLKLGYPPQDEVTGKLTGMFWYWIECCMSQKPDALPFDRL